jgi:uncharacterized protein (DUF433 family)
VEWRDRIVVDTNVCDGRPCIKGSLIPVSDIADALANGGEIHALMTRHPSLQREDIQAAMVYAMQQEVNWNH